MIISGRRKAVTMGLSEWLGGCREAARIHIMQKAICTGLVLKYGIMVNCRPKPFFDFKIRHMKPFTTNSMEW